MSENSANQTFDVALFVSVFAHARGVLDKLQPFVGTHFIVTPEGRRDIREEFNWLIESLNALEPTISSIPKSVLTDIEAIGAIVNEAADNVSFPEVYKSLWESDLEKHAKHGWREVVRLKNGPAIGWAEKTELVSPEQPAGGDDGAGDGDANTPEGKDEVSEPFKVNEDLSQIRINGKSHDIPMEAARMAKLLLDANGEWVAMAKNDFTKPSETRRKLPKSVQDLIETQKGKGYRIQ